jgi:hypothetical protein
LMRQAAPPRGGAGADTAASDLPGPARYALPGDDMDAAGAACVLETGGHRRAPVAESS